MSFFLLSILSTAAAQLSTSFEVVSDLVTYIPEATTFTEAGVVYDIAGPTTLTIAGPVTRTHTYSTSTVVVCPSETESVETATPTNTVSPEYTMTNQTIVRSDSATIVSPETIVPMSSVWTPVYTSQPTINPVEPTTQSTIVPINNGARSGAQFAVVAAAVLALF